MSKEFRTFQETVIQSYRQNKVSSSYTQAFVYAIAHKICPIFDLNYCQEFEADFSVAKEFVENIAEYIEKKNKFRYENFKDKFYDDNSSIEKFKMDLLHCLRYLYLTERFSEIDWEFYNTSKDCPQELKFLNSDFSLDTDLFLD